MENIISKIHEGSIAEEMGVETGDILLSINGTSVKDIIDYKFLIVDDEIMVQIQKPNGEVWDLEIEKEYDEDFGVEFKNAIIDNAKSCCNNCVFCFIDQLPKGMRDTLYFKDDDSRLSFLQGNFVTLTNMKDEDIDRIIRYRISPINVSVHTTNPELRTKMLNNRFAGNIYERLKKLASAGIRMNCQIVLCPGFNNGIELAKTVEDLYKLYPSVENVAAVPVGITKYREGLQKLTLYDKKSASEEIRVLEELQNKYIDEIGSPFIRLSDEFYVLSGIEVPPTEFYAAFDQFEDGVGMIRCFRDNIAESLSKLNKNASGSYTLVTGTSAYEEIKRAAENIMDKNPNIKINTQKIKNFFFGETITVAGLLTGGDIIEQLKDVQLGDYVIIPRNMLKNGEDIFLDDVSLMHLEESLKTKVIVCDYSGSDLIEIINRTGREENNE